jgi:hypothetical protein
VGTVYGRLARARDLLRDRLARRCLLAPAAILLAEDVAPATVPAALLDATVQAAVLPGPLVGPVAKIAEGVLHTMYVTKLKMTAVLLLTVGLIGAGAGASVYHHQRGQGSVAAAANLAPLPDTETKVAEDGKVRSKVVRVNGVDFQAAADKVWVVPAANKKTVVDIALVISNSTDKEQTFLIWEMPHVHLATPEGKELSWEFGRNGTRPVTRLAVSAGKTVSVSRRAMLEHRADDRTLVLGGNDDSGGVWWFNGLQPTKYVLTLSYENNQQSKDAWGGSVKTAPVEITVRTAKEEVPAKKELFAKEKWYADQNGKEEDFVGVLERVTEPESKTLQRHRPYRLVMTVDKQKVIRDIYVGAEKGILDAYVGKTVKMTGKAVDFELEGQQWHELWPARVELQTEKQGER